MSTTSELVTITLKREAMLDFPETPCTSNYQEACLFEEMSSSHWYYMLIQMTDMLKRVLTHLC